MQEIFSRKLNGVPISSIYLLSILRSLCNLILSFLVSLLQMCHCSIIAVQLPNIFRTISILRVQIGSALFSDEATRLSPTLWGYEADRMFSNLKQKTAKDYRASQAILSGRYRIPVSKSSMSVSHMDAQFHCSI